MVDSFVETLARPAWKDDPCENWVPSLTGWNDGPGLGERACRRPVEDRELRVFDDVVLPAADRSCRRSSI